MTYNPNTGISSNKAPALLGIPIDHRTWKQTGPDDNENNIYRPFNSENEVLAYFDTYDKREGGFEIDVLTNGKISKYQFVNGELKPTVGGDYIETNIDEINNKVTQNTTSISQNAHEIALKANQTDVNTLSGRVTQHDASFVITAKEIASKVSQKDFNLLGQAVYNAETSIAQTAQQIQLKASKQSVDELTGRVVVAESSITQTAESIALKADKSVVDSLTGTVNDNTSELLILSDEIATKVSSTVTDALGVRVGAAESSVTQLSNEITSKVSQTDFNSLGGRVSTTESKITQIEGDITSVVTQSEFDGLENRVDLTESSISQQAGQIASKVEQSTFNALGTRVTNAESAITQNANNINLKVSQTDFTGANIVSQINLAPDTIKIAAKNINIQGAVTFSAFDTTTQNTINTASSNASNAVGTANTANTNANTALTRADDAIAKIGPLPTGKTIIVGGMINTDLLVADTVIAKQVVTSGTNNITLNQNEDNQLKFRHTNDQVGIQIGIINGELKLVFYNENGNKVWEAGQSGIVYVDNVAESWNTRTYRLVMEDPGRSSFFHPEIQNDIRAAIAPLVTMDYDADTIIVTPGPVIHYYHPGTNTNTPVNEKYKGYHTSQVKSLDNWITPGWYIDTDPRWPAVEWTNGRFDRPRLYSAQLVYINEYNIWSEDDGGNDYRLNNIVAYT